MPRSKIFSVTVLVAIILMILLLFNKPIKAQETCKSVVTTIDRRPTIIRELRELDGFVDMLRENNVPVQDLPWVQLLENSINPALRPDTPFLLAAIVGRTNTGKSTLFNALDAILIERPVEKPIDTEEVVVEGNLERPVIEPGEAKTKTGLDAGLTRRLTLLASDELGPDPLVRRFGAIKPWQSAEETSQEGVPVFLTVAGIPKNIVFIDTPGIEGLEITMSKGVPILQRPFSTLRTAEVLIFIFSKHETGDPHHLSMLQEALKVWGQRKLILVFNVDEHIAPETAISEIQKVGRRFDPNFEISQIGRSTTPIIGAYVLPESSRVFQGLEIPRLVPVKKSLPFPDLVDALSTNVVPVWENVFNDSISKVAEGARTQLAEVTRNKLELELLRHTIALMVLDSARFMIYNFPYARMRDSLHDYWRHVGSDSSRALRDMADWTARPEKQLLGRWFNRRGEAVAGTYLGNRLIAADIQGPRSEEEVRILSALNRLAKELSDGEIIVDPELTSDPQRAALVEKIKEIDARLTEILPTESFITQLPNGTLDIELGTYSKYRTEIAQIVRQTLDAGLENHVQPLLNTLSQYNPPLSERVSYDLIQHLKDVKDRQGFVQRSLDDAIPQLHWLLPGGVIAAEFYAHYVAHAINFNPFSYLIPGNVAARVAFAIDRNYIDSILQPEVQRWSVNRQQAIFASYVNTNILNELLLEIKKEEARLSINDRRAAAYMRIIDRLTEQTANATPFSLEKPIEGRANEGVLQLQSELAESIGAPSQRERRWYWPFGNGR